MLTNLLKHLGTHTLIYSAGTILGRMAGFLMIPVYTRHLTPKDYGVLDLLEVTVFVLATVLGAGLSGAIVRLYHDCQAETERHAVVSTALTFALPVQLVAFGLLVWIAPDLARLVFGSDVYGPYFRVIFATLCFDLLNEMALANLVAKRLSARYSLVSIARLVLGLGLNVYFVVFRELGVWGVLYGGAIAAGVVSTVMVALTFREVGFALSREKLRALLAFGLPLIPASLALFALNFADRFFLQRWSSLAEVGIYALGYKLGMVTGVLVTGPFLMCWNAYMYEVAEKPDGRALMARVQVYFSLILTWASLAIAVLADVIVRVLSPPPFWGAAAIAPIITLSYVFFGVSYFFRSGIAITKRTEYSAYSVGAVAAVNLGLNALLIPTYGALGAAVATLVSFMLFAVVTWAVSQWLFPIPYEYGRLVKIVGAAVAVWGLSRLLHPEGLRAALLLDVALVLSYPLVLWAVGAFRDDETDRVQAVLRGRGWVPAWASRWRA